VVERVDVRIVYAARVLREGVELLPKRVAAAISVCHGKLMIVTNLYRDATYLCGTAEERMDEHDDDLESTVDEGAEQEVETFPDTDDEPDDPVEGDGDELGLDDDEPEL
jgi:hypothetical protein